jgi:hypothetical protein
MPATVAWKWQADADRHATGSSMSKSSPPQGFAEDDTPYYKIRGSVEIFKAGNPTALYVHNDDVLFNVFKKFKRSRNPL